MNNLELLKQLGLEEKESQVYLALLELGSASVYSISTKSGLKRPTTYLVLASLEKRGLVSQIPEAKKTLYVAESPEKLTQDLKRKESLMRENLPALLALHNSRKDKPQVKLYQGEKGVEEVYKQILNAKEVKFFATISDVIKIYPQFVKDLIKKTNIGQIRVKEILTRDKVNEEFTKITNNPYYEQRFAKEGMKFLTDNVVFDDTVVFFSFTPFIFAVEISSKDISQSLSTLFDMAWEQAVQ